MFDGYISHNILVDQDDKGHLLVISKWDTRDAADKTRVGYANADTVKRIKPLLQKERARWAFDEDQAKHQRP